MIDGTDFPTYKCLLCNREFIFFYAVVLHQRKCKGVKNA